MGKKKGGGGGQNQNNDGDGEGGDNNNNQGKKDKKLTRPNPPQKVADPLPSLAAAVKSLGELQVIVVKASSLYCSARRD